MYAAGHDTTKGRTHIGASNLIVNLPQPNLDELRVRKREIAIRLGLLELEL